MVVLVKLLVHLFELRPKLKLIASLFEMLKTRDLGLQFLTTRNNKCYK